MGETKSKSPARRPKKAANSPAPSGMGGSMCGHSGCAATCKVRYCGPTTHMRDHHILHAARGVAHVWTAAIVAGLAVVLTGAIAFSAVDAATTGPNASMTSLAEQIKGLNKRMDTLQGMLKKLNDQCSVTNTQCKPNTENTTPPTTEQKACLEACTKTSLDCLKGSGDNTDSRKACLTANATCRTTCVSPTTAAAGQ